MTEVPPDAGTGSVFVTCFRDGSWTAIWQDDGPSGRHVTASGSREDVLGWARRQPARTFWIFDEDVDCHVPLSFDGEEDAHGG